MLSGRFFVEQNEPDDQFIEPKYTVQKDFKYPSFDLDTPWNECKPVLGMKFESPPQLKQCLANYDVTHGYQLWYMQNDTYKLLVKCGRDVSAGSSDKDKGKVGEGSSDKGKGKLGEESSEPSNVSQATKERWRKKKLEKKKNLKNAVDCPFRLWAGGEIVDVVEVDYEGKFEVLELRCDVGGDCVDGGCVWTGCWDGEGRMDRWRSRVGFDKVM
ncbi:hypothetical protein Tco_0191382 [Tanacetum coccineum]